MTRINTNVSSLIAQKTLQRSNADLQTSLTRLSTGLRINSGKDDPSGLIASENLRSDIVSVEGAITNTERANQIIATADSALSQVSSLLNDIRGLVTESANDGALTPDQVAANQLQVDSSLEALNRISQTTSFQGRNLLDGSLDFITSGTSNFSAVQNLQIDQAAFGTSSSIGVSVVVSAAATQATVETDIDATTAAEAAEATGDLNLVGGGTSSGTFTVTAAADGEAFNDITINIVEDAAIADGAALAEYDSVNGEINVRVSDSDDTTTATIVAAIDGLDDFGATLDAAGDGYLFADSGGTVGTLAGGVDGGAGLLADVVFELGGSEGSEVFTFEAGTTVSQVADAINLVKDATGVEASVDGDTLSLQSTAYGESAFVDVNVISEGAGGAFESGFATSGTTTRDEGTDVSASVNGVTASSSGNTLSINTATLDLTATIENDASGFTTGTITFDITGGGALFQLGPDVVSNQQARLGVGSVNTSRLGGIRGKLFQLGSGGTAALATDATTAAKIVDEAINQVTSLRGRLGAFQKTTLESNLVSLNDTLVNLTDAESAIRDADFAQETAQLTRAQILVQSGTSVLGIVNQNPQNVLALLR